MTTQFALAGSGGSYAVVITSVSADSRIDLDDRSRAARYGRAAKRGRDGRRHQVGVGPSTGEESSPGNGRSTAPLHAAPRRPDAHTGLGPAGEGDTGGVISRPTAIRRPQPFPGIRPFVVLATLVLALAALVPGSADTAIPPWSGRPRPRARR